MLTLTQLRLDLLARNLVKKNDRRGYPLLFLPSTSSAFELLVACTRHGHPVKAVGHRGLVESWFPSASPWVHTPLSLWRQVRNLYSLPFIVAVFQDQLASIDDSYHSVDVDGLSYQVSPVEVMLLMRFRPDTHLGVAESRAKHGRPSMLILRPYAVDIPRSITATAMNSIMADIIRPLASYQKKDISDWYARNTFALKQGTNFYLLLSQRIQEIQGLIRTYRDRHIDPSAFAPWLCTLDAARIEIRNQLRS